MLYHRDVLKAFKVGGYVALMLGHWMLGAVSQYFLCPSFAVN